MQTPIHISITLELIYKTDYQLIMTYPYILSRPDFTVRTLKYMGMPIKICVIVKQGLYINYI